ncbi:MAG: anti-sigma factor [FCB group bacterium]|nr:anti-sigma factor [FCB group bacterium]
MAEGENKSQSFGSSDERFKYVGFDVFPGKLGNIFKSDKERQSLIQKVMGKFNRSEGEVRDRCTLIEERISKLEQGFLTAAAVVMILALFLPWFSGYVEVTTTKQVPIEEVQAAAVADSTAVTSDSAATAGLIDSVATGDIPAEPATTEPAGNDLVAAGEGDAVDTAVVAGATETPPQGFRTVTEVTHEPYSITGFGALLSLGEYGSMVFSSGIILVLTGVLMIVYFLSCLGLGAYNLYLLFGIKKPTADERALFLKNKLRFNWIPVYIWLAMLVLSMIGANYGFDSEGMVNQVGDSYSVASFLGLTSAGIYVALAAFLVAAMKGKEI